MPLQAELSEEYEEMEKVSVFCNNRNKYLKLTSLFVINSMRDTQHIDRYEDLRLRHSMYVWRSASTVWLSAGKFHKHP